MPNVSYFVLAGSNGPQIPNFTYYPTDVYLGRYENGPVWDQTIVGTPTAYAPSNLLFALGASFSVGGAPSFSDANINTWTTRQAYAAGQGGMLAYSATANAVIAPDQFNYNPQSWNAGSFLAILEFSTPSGSYTSTYGSSSTGVISVTTPGGYTLTLNLNNPGELIVFEWGNGVAGQTYRVAYSNTCNGSTMFPAGWTERSADWFPGVLNNGASGANSHRFFEFTDIPCVLSVTPSALSFSASLGSNPPAQTVNISSNAGAEAWTATSDQTWLSISPTGGTTPQSASVTIDVSGLVAGTYVGHLTFGSVCTSPTITVTLIVSTPCAVTDGNGNVVSTFFPDLCLNITPTTELYANLVPSSQIAAYESYSEGRAAIVLDFNQGQGIYARDLGTIFSWTMKCRPVLRVWQPSLIEQPEGIYGRGTDWDNGGTPGNKFFQGVMVEANSFNRAKTFFLQDSDTLTLHTLNECPVTFNGQSEKAFSCIPFTAHSVRIISSDGVEWAVFSATPVFQPWPESTLNWQTELTALGMVGWAHAREMNIPYVSTTPLTLVLTFDAGPAITVHLPSSGGVQNKTKVTLTANKFKLMGLQVYSTAPFNLFASDMELKVKQWGSQGEYQILKPFGGNSSAGATV